MTHLMQKYNDPINDPREDPMDDITDDPTDDLTDDPTDGPYTIVTFQNRVKQLLKLLNHSQDWVNILSKCTTWWLF